MEIYECLQLWGKSSGRVGVNLISAVSLRGDMRFQCIDGEMSSKKLIQFLKKLHSDAKQSILIIADNTRYHHSKETQRFIEKQKEIILEFIPPSSP